ncbi:hypothetical protein HAHE_13590 [Haloferula helveola]|uniref:Uncharacterized protein n=1 Tax=Haloferula helveola TaxID=490095 RepID=A0ABN6H1T1_9BACT|nr:hypothetical protein HAHE_13590 [Haloferula helveola]
MINTFLPFVGTAFLAAAAWTVFTLRTARPQRRFMGPVGAWIGTAVLAALWQAEAIPWLWIFLKVVLLAWMAAIVLLITDIVVTSIRKDPSRGLRLLCAGVSLVANIGAGLVFLWIATVSAGGV